MPQQRQVFGSARRNLGSMRSLRVVLLLTLGLGLLPGLAHADPSVATGVAPERFDDEEECLEATPAAYAVPGASDELTLEVLVLLDGPTLEQGRKVMDRAADAYTPLGIELRPHYEEVDFVPENVTADRESSHYRRLVQDAKDHTVGVRPPDVDLVYVMTSKDIEGAAGFADCIGGVRYPNRAYSVGEFHEQEVLSVGLNFYVDRNAETVSHELGHLMGAHHHYANCAQGVGADDVTNREPAPCTLMFNFLDFTSINFSAINSAVVTGHAEQFASDTPGSDLVFDRVVELTLKGHLRAEGVVSSSGPKKCVARVPLDIVRHDGRSWIHVTTTKTDRAGRYRVTLEDGSFSYRAQVGVHELDGGKAGYCRQSVTQPAEHKH